jgi:hypothetical protein
MTRRSIALAVGIALALLFAFSSVAFADGANVMNGRVTFSPTSPCLPFPEVGASVCGRSGTVDFHIVQTPSGNENSHFKVENFTGFIVGGPMHCTQATCSLTNASGMVVLHLGPEPSRPMILVNHGPEGVPHRIS